MTFTAKQKKSSRTICSPRRRGGDGGNRTPVRKRFLRNFSGRRRLFAFPRPCASRHARGLGSFMMHGTLKALRTHGPHSSTPLSGPWASRKRRSRIKRREEQCCRCSLIYKLPVLWMPGASARYSCLRTPVETSTSPCVRIDPADPAAARGAAAVTDGSIFPCVFKGQSFEYAEEQR